MQIGWYLPRALCIPYASSKDKCLLKWLGVKFMFVVHDPIVRIYSTYSQMWGLLWWHRDRWERAGKTCICGYGFSHIKVCKNLDFDPCLSAMTDDALFNSLTSLSLCFCQLWSGNNVCALEAAGETVCKRPVITLQLSVGSVEVVAIEVLATCDDCALGGHLTWVSIYDILCSVKVVNLLSVMVMTIMKIIMIAHLTYIHFVQCILHA